jgi:endogenous inhibitor of DNA gyrase (YacG/DUF329 family)
MNSIVSLVHCPVCDQPFDSEHSDSLPFCSTRCKRIDLARWLDERYSMPIERAEDGGDGDATPADND